MEQMAKDQISNMTTIPPRGCLLTNIGFSAKLLWVTIPTLLARRLFMFPGHALLRMQMRIS
jgi:hypothetical protein